MLVSFPILLNFVHSCFILLKKKKNSLQFPFFTAFHTHLSRPTLKNSRSSKQTLSTKNVACVLVVLAIFVFRRISYRSTVVKGSLRNVLLNRSTCCIITLPIVSLCFTHALFLLFHVIFLFSRCLSRFFPHFMHFCFYLIFSTPHLLSPPTAAALITTRPETVTWHRDRGVQLRAQTRGGGVSVRFVDPEAIDAVVVNESIHFNSVIAYVCLRMNTSKNLVLLFRVSMSIHPSISPLLFIHLHTNKTK